jgi:hypothetical protein
MHVVLVKVSPPALAVGVGVRVNDSFDDRGLPYARRASITKIQACCTLTTCMRAFAANPSVIPFTVLVCLQLLQSVVVGFVTCCFQKETI